MGFGATYGYGPKQRQDSRSPAAPSGPTALSEWGLGFVSVSGVSEPQTPVRPHLCAKGSALLSSKEIISRLQAPSLEEVEGRRFRAYYGLGSLGLRVHTGLGFIGLKPHIPKPCTSHSLQPGFAIPPSSRLVFLLLESATALGLAGVRHALAVRTVAQTSLEELCVRMTPTQVPSTPEHTSRPFSIDP